MSFDVAWASCEQRPRPFLPGHHIARLNPVLFVALDDVPYYNSAGTFYGETLARVGVASTKAHWEQHLANMLLEAGWQAILAARANGMQMWYTPGDHGWGGDNWDHTLATANATGSTINATTQLEVDNHWWQGNQHMLDKAWYDNLTNTHPLAVAEKPSGADPSTPASNYPVRYFMAGYDIDGNRNDANPHCEIYLLDDMSYKSPINAVDNADKTMLGANQTAWLKAKLAASTATFKLIFCAKKTYGSVNKVDGGYYDNLDAWPPYSTDRDALLDYLDAEGVTGMVWLAGDSHIPAIESRRIADGHERDHLCVDAAPAGNVIKETFENTAINDQTRILFEYQAYGTVRIEAEKLEIRIHNAATGEVMWTGIIAAGSNALEYPQTRFG